MSVPLVSPRATDTHGHRPSPNVKPPPAKCWRRAGLRFCVSVSPLGGASLKTSRTTRPDPPPENPPSVHLKNTSFAFLGALNGVADWAF